VNENSVKIEVGRYARLGDYSVVLCQLQCVTPIQMCAGAHI